MADSIIPRILFDAVTARTTLVNANVNDINNSGIYVALATCTGLPSNTEWYTLISFAGATGSFVQFACGSVTFDIYYRHNNGVVWGEWQKLN